MSFWEKMKQAEKTETPLKPEPVRPVAPQPVEVRSMAMLKREEEAAFRPSGGTATLLGAGSEFDGKLSFQGTVHIDGKFSGEIHTSDELNIGQAAKVSAEIFVGSVVIHGEVNGNIHAKSEVDLEATARVFGNIETPALVIKKGAIFEGATKMSAKVTTLADAKPAPVPAVGAPAVK